MPTNEELTIQVENLKQEVAKLQENLNVNYRQLLRLTNALQGNKIYYVATGPTGATQTPLTFKDGILSEES